MNLALVKQVRDMQPAGECEILADSLPKIFRWGVHAYFSYLLKYYDCLSLILPEELNLIEAAFANAGGFTALQASRDKRDRSLQEHLSCLNSLLNIPCPENSPRSSFLAF